MCHWYSKKKKESLSVFIVVSKLTSPFGGKVVQVLDVIPAGLNILVNNVGRDGTDFHKAVMLDENCVAGQIAVNDWRAALLVQVAKKKEGGKIESDH